MKTKVIEFIYRVQDGGAETLVKDYALLLNKEFFDVTIMCCDIRKNSGIYKILKENGIRIVSLYEPLFTFNKIITRVFGKKHIARLLRKELIKERPDVVHIHLEWLETFMYCSEVLKDTKLFYTCHNVPKTMLGDDVSKEREAAEFLIKNNDLRIIALYRNMANEINSILKIDNTLVINNGINFEEFLKTNTTKQEVRKELGIPNDAFLIGHVGRFIYQKNHEKIVDVFKEITKINKNAYLLLIGTGSLLNEINRKIDNLGLKNRVLILSNRNDVSELLLAMDVFLFPSRYEGISIALIEAQARDLPCIVSNKVNRETYFSSKITELSIDDDNETWANACISQIGNVQVINTKNNFDLIKEIKTLEKYYLL